MKIFQMIRLGLILWSAVMITAIDWVGISSQGLVEIEEAKRVGYVEILVMTTCSFLGDAALAARRKG